MSSSCKGLIEKYADCLRNSDCMKVIIKTPSISYVIMHSQRVDVGTPKVNVYCFFPLIRI
jgi:hypothetical protein